MLNHIDIMGRMVRDPDMRRTGSGIAVANFTLAVDRDFGQDGQKETDFIDCVAWRHTADFVGKYFKKGSMAVAAGRLQSRKWTDKEGNKRTAWEVQVENVYFGSSKRDSENSIGGNSYGGNSYGGSYGGDAGNSGVPVSYDQQEFAVLDDDDSQLPF